ncbi:MAG: glycoside hydrolase family 15 protein [Chloroflexi bacterium]|nr:glycoside hydrolase family 15 protein [Chloroflexota bacterium]
MSCRYPPVADYAVVGDCHTAALIARDGSVDWLCPGRFDAPAVFCRILDLDKGGCFRSAPTGSFHVERRYVGDTNVLETTFSTDGGRLRMTDVMPLHKRTSDHQGNDAAAANRLLRSLECLDGEVELRVQFNPTFNFGRDQTHLDLHASAGAIARSHDQYLTLACDGISLEQDAHGGVSGVLRLHKGEHRWLALTCAQNRRDAEQGLHVNDGQHQLRHTTEYWRQWAARCTYRGPYRDKVVRSALALKLLTYEPTGAVVAAPTTSLPERVGGGRNWDYRYTWLRDSSLILYALLTIGYGDEAADFTHWLERTVGSDSRQMPKIMYGIDGRSDLPEKTLDHLDGYCGSKPVRIGNAAASQHQLDIFGEVLRATEMHYRQGTDAPHEGEPARPRSNPPSDEAWTVLRELVEQAATHWDERGSGIWEVRGGPEPFLYGKLMCWSALDSGVRLAQQYHLNAPIDDWQHTRDEIRNAILEQGYNAKIGAFTQSFGSDTLDASALIIPQIGFLSATDSRVASTVDQIRHHLTRDGLVYRYRTKDGLAGGEGTFTLCTFWLVDALALCGEHEEARALFEKLISFTNDLGLLSEEIDPDNREQLGNFPQGFSHLALIGAAVNLMNSSKHGAEQDAHNAGDRVQPASRAASHTG